MMMRKINLNLKKSAFMDPRKIKDIPDMRRYETTLMADCERFK